MSLLYSSVRRIGVGINLTTVFAAVLLRSVCLLAQSPSKPAPATTESPRTPWIALTIKSVKPTSYGFDVLVTVRNDGKALVVLALLGDGRMAANPTLQSLTVEQWDQNQGWQNAGRCIEAMPEYTVTMYPGWVIDNTIPILDPARMELDPMCLTHITHLDGKIRAALYSVYDSEKQFRDRMNSPYTPAHLESASKPVQLPRRRTAHSKRSITAP